jgi:hypothetical protein
MKQITNVRSNFLNLIDHETNEQRPHAEVVLIFTEPSYKSTPDKEIQRSDHTSAVRFIANIEALRQLSKDLAEMADELEEINAPQQKDEPAKA